MSFLENSILVPPEIVSNLRGQEVDSIPEVSDFQRLLARIVGPERHEIQVLAQFSEVGLRLTKVPVAGFCAQSRIGVRPKWC